jgi:hypothetical protein
MDASRVCIYAQHDQIVIPRPHCYLTNFNGREESELILVGFKPHQLVVRGALSHPAKGDAFSKNLALLVLSIY